MELLFQYFEIVLTLILLAVGFFAGRFLEARHYASIRAREKQYRKILAFSARYPPNMVEPQDTRLVCGTVVISSDYFKQFVAGLRNFIGGRFRSYESLFDRARREAILRMKMDAHKNGYALIINVKFVSTSIGGNVTGQQGMPCFEICAYGTAMRPQKARFPDKLTD
ncbi:MAG: heavy metal-binding domain-containing protein [Burkholderiales bacterium]|nr:heavy metal-binding domain-containing protein [Burkholderiales bacterium]